MEELSFLTEKEQQKEAALLEKNYHTHCYRRIYEGVTLYCIKYWLRNKDAKPYSP